MPPVYPLSNRSQCRLPNHGADSFGQPRRDKDFDPWQMLVAYVEAGHHVDPATGRCKSLGVICRELEVGKGCFDEGEVVRLTGASWEDIRGLPPSGRPPWRR